MLACDGIFAGMLNFKAGIQFQLSNQKSILKRNQGLQIKGDDKDICFVLGNGPSLKKVNFDFLAPFPCFTTNMFYVGNNGFKSKYHLLIDPAYGTDELLPYVKQVHSENKETNLILNKRFKNRAEQEGLLGDRIYFVNISYVSHGNEVRCDMQKAMSGSLNVIPVAIECAIYMGYKKIYLLGCDFNSYVNGKYEHYNDPAGYEDMICRRGIVGELIRCAIIHNQHYALDEYSRAHGSKIINLTEGSLIDAYERDTLENVLLRKE